MRYHQFSIFLHWLMVVLIALLFVCAWYMTELPDDHPQRSFYFGLHKSLGLTAALLIAVRLAWRFIKPPPALPKMALLQAKTAQFTHHALYFLLVLQPLSGYLSSSFSGYKTRFWGIPLPHWGWKMPALNEFFTSIHYLSSIALLVLVVVHIGAVILHAWRGASVLGRMMPWGKEAPYTHQR